MCNLPARVTHHQTARQAPAQAQVPFEIRVGTVLTPLPSLAGILWIKIHAGLHVHCSCNESNASRAVGCCANIFAPNQEHWNFTWVRFSDSLKPLATEAEDMGVLSTCQIQLRGNSASIHYQERCCHHDPQPYIWERKSCCCNPDWGGAQQFYNTFSPMFYHLWGWDSPCNQWHVLI